MDDRPIGMFDSGVGGLKILSACRRLMPRESFVYAFDRSHAPYGNRSERSVARRAEAVTKKLIERDVKAVVVACNTATYAAIDRLRERFKLPIVGVEPPVKPAALSVRAGKILVLTTALTATRPRFRELVSRFDRDGRVIVAPLPGLASAVERNFAALGELNGDVDAMLAPYDGEDIRAVVLGCTHFYYVADAISAHFGGKAVLFDAAGGTAARLKDLLSSADMLSSAETGCVRHLYL